MIIRPPTCRIEIFVTIDCEFCKKNEVIHSSYVWLVIIIVMHTRDLRLLYDHDWVWLVLNTSVPS